MLANQREQTNTMGAIAKRFGLKIPAKDEDCDD